MAAATVVVAMVAARAVEATVGGGEVVAAAMAWRLEAAAGHRANDRGVTERR